MDRRRPADLLLPGVLWLLAAQLDLLALLSLGDRLILAALLHLAGLLPLAVRLDLPGLLSLADRLHPEVPWPLAAQSALGVQSIPGVLQVPLECRSNQIRFRNKFLQWIMNPQASQLEWWH